MIPAYRLAVEEGLFDAKSWRKAAVLILLYPNEAGELCFPLVERSPHVGHHRGEIGLPGGSLEAGETAAAAALRETGEELGLSPPCAAAIDLLGSLSPLRIPPSGFEAMPFLGSLAERPRMTALAGEIDGIVEARLARLLETDARREEERSFEGRLWRVPYFEIGEKKVWGATAMILSELAELLRGLLRLA
jgi:8-oxo-dGTP pyrophosphatase MutT (NUDIX family)